jgi:hypothetical protein
MCTLSEEVFVDNRLTNSPVEARATGAAVAETTTTAAASAPWF